LHWLYALYRENGDIDPYVLNLGTRWKRVIILMPRPVFLQYPLGGSPDGPQNQYIDAMEKRKMP
jgi:hypothetical protein